jgi:ketosteroid isomerase-like protein
MTLEDEILLQNARFYEAFEQKNLDQLDDVWSHKDHCTCIHPGWNVLTGWKDIRQSWERIFTNEMVTKFSLRNVRTMVLNDIAIVLLEEEVTFVSGLLSQTRSIIATNIFEHEAGTWRMIHHHGSPLAGMNSSEGDDDANRFRYN